MRFKNLDLIAALFIVALNLGWVQLPDRPWLIGLLLALPLVLFLPGYTLTQTLFRKQTPAVQSSQTRARTQASEPAPRPAPLRLGHPIGASDQLILSLGLSMAIDILVGFVLNLLPLGLQALSWALALGLVTALFACVALLVRRTVKPGETAQKKPPLRVTLLDAVFLLLAGCIVLNALWLAIIRPPAPQPSFTQFWMLPTNPTSKTCTVSLGVQNAETDSVTYSITLSVNHVPVSTNWSTIVLAPQQKWEQQIPITPEAQNDLLIEAQLYRADNPQTVYRNVYLTFHVATVLQNGRAQIQCSTGT